MRPCLVTCVLAGLVLGGCDLLDPNRPTAYPDTIVYGNLLQLDEATGEQPPVLTLRVGVPRALAAAEEEQGKPTPDVEEQTTATVTITPDTLVVADGRPATLEAFAPGQELMVQPVPGSTRMRGSDQVFVDAELVSDFASYRRWRLPGLVAGDEPSPAAPAPGAVTTAGVERSPVPVGDGRILYFTYRLRRPAEGDWAGLRRPGLPEPTETMPVVERTYRTALGADGWSAPEPVRFPGLAEDTSQSLTWIADDESVCLVTVTPAGEPSWIGRVVRAGGGWGEVERLEVLGDGVAGGTYLAGSRTMITYTSFASGPAGDLWLYDPKNEATPLPLEPKINTAAPESDPRVGPEGKLYFTRSGQPFMLSEGRILALAIAGQHRAAASGVQPTADGARAFLAIPRFSSGELDLDLYVAEIEAVGRLAEPQPVDDWRP